MKQFKVVGSRIDNKGNEVVVVFRPKVSAEIGTDAINTIKSQTLVKQPDQLTWAADEVKGNVYRG